MDKTHRKCKVRHIQSTHRELWIYSALIEVWFNNLHVFETLYRLWGHNYCIFPGIHHTDFHHVSNINHCNSFYFSWIHERVETPWRHFKSSWKISRKFWYVPCLWFYVTPSCFVFLSDTAYLPGQSIIETNWARCINPSSIKMTK